MPCKPIIEPVPDSLLDPIPDDDRPLDTWGEFFGAFHRLWGLNAANAPYNKALWASLGEFLEQRARGGDSQLPRRPTFLN